MKSNRQVVLSIIRKSVEPHTPWFLPDTALAHALLPPAVNRASETDILKVFAGGQGTVAGAYRITEMRKICSGLTEWQKKLSDAWGRYAREEIEIYARCADNVELGKKLRRLCPEICRFVHDALHFRLDDGTQFGDRLSNLEERAATRNAVKLFLRVQEVIRPPFVDNPLKEFNETCNRVVSKVWRQNEHRFRSGGKWDIERLMVLSALLNTLDFETVVQSRKGSMAKRILEIANRQFEKAHTHSFSAALGGNTFSKEFLEQLMSVKNTPGPKLVYLTHKNGQLVISLKCMEAILERCPKMKIVLTPKGAPYGSEATKADVQSMLDEDEKSSKPIFGKIDARLKTGRLVICADGPKVEGLHPGGLSQELCYHLQKADFVLAEGQAYAEIRGWLKPTFVVFQIKGRVAEAIHGVERGNGITACIRLGHGAVHFGNADRLPKRSVSATAPGRVSFHMFGQTTSDYCQALCSPNLSVLLNRFFKRDENAFYEHLNTESEVTGKTRAEIILGTDAVSVETSQTNRRKYPPRVFAMGGGGGFAHVTLKALRMLGFPVAAGVTATDDGGSTGKLQKMLFKRFGHVFGMGDAAAILEQQLANKAKQPILSYRIPEGSNCLLDALTDLILKEVISPTFEGSCLADCPDYLSFVCEQLNLARIIDTDFLGSRGVPGFSVEGSSIRNLTIIAALHKCNAFLPHNHKKLGNCALDAAKAEAAWFFLEQALGLNPAEGKSVRTIPTSYDQAILWAQYDKPIPYKEIKRLKMQPASLSNDRRTVWGQHYIDEILPDARMVKFGVASEMGSKCTKDIRPNPDYIESMRAAKLIVMGAGSLFSSQLSQLAVPGVMVELLEKRNARKVLIVNHVCMNETLFYSLSDHIAAIEALANDIVPFKWKQRLNRPIQIGDIFTDVVVPRTVAREIDIAMRTDMTTRLGGYWEGRKKALSRRRATPEYIRMAGIQKDIFKNRYVAYLLANKPFLDQQRVTEWELYVLSYMEQPPSLFQRRSEAGRYRGPVYAVQADYDYLLTHGIPPRNIYEVESIGMNRKILKAEGKLETEEFPGLIPESLMGIFKILLQKGTNPT